MTRGGVVGARERYRIGDAMCRESHSIPPPPLWGDDEVECMPGLLLLLLLGQMPLGSHLFVRRTSGAWTYAMLLGRGNGGGALLVLLDPPGLRRVRTKVVGRASWRSCIRFVNGMEVVDNAPPPPSPCHLSWARSAPTMSNDACSGGGGGGAGCSHPPTSPSCRRGGGRDGTLL